MNENPGILSGYRVVDCSIAMAGPFAAQRLGDLGADVVKVEPPAGEWQRFAAAGGAKGNRINVSFLSLNRNKRSLAVDLKADAGKRIVRALVASADVLKQPATRAWTAATSAGCSGRIVIGAASLSRGSIRTAS